MENMLRVNLEAPVILTRIILKRMIEERLPHPALVYTGSLSSIIPACDEAIFSATKGALHAFVRHIPLEIPDGFNVQVVCFCPGRSYRNTDQTAIAEDIAEKIVIGLARKRSGFIYLYESLHEQVIASLTIRA